jgi:hypothetical protein
MSSIGPQLNERESKALVDRNYFTKYDYPACAQGQTVLSGKTYTPGQILLLRNGGFVPFADYTALDGLTITVPAADANEEFSIIEFSSFEVAGSYTKAEEDQKFVDNFKSGFGCGSFGFKNRIINGNFDFWQRGTNFAPGAGAILTADRWMVTGVASAVQSTFTLGESRTAGMAVESQYYISLTRTAALANYPTLEQRIEDVRSFAGQTVTISFWARTPTAWNGSGNWQIWPYQNFGSGGSATGAFGSTNFVPTTNWQKFTATVNVPSIAGKTIGAGSFLGAVLRYSAQDTTAGRLDVAQFQVEAGDKASPFELRPLALELAMCQRYYEKSYDLTTAPATATHVGTSRLTLGGGMLVQEIAVTFKVPKRATPTVVTYSPSGAVSKCNSNGSDQPCGLSYTSTTGTNPNNAGTLYRDFAVHWTAEAEL